jgi:hypothetical protein
MKVFVATLCPGGILSVNHHRSMIETILVFKQELPEIEFKLSHISTSMGSYARNAPASIVLNDPALTHLLFIDGDMGFPVSLIVKMLAFGKPIVGCVCPDKKFDYKRFHNSRLTTDDPQIARHLATACIGGESAFIATKGPKGERQVQLVESFARVNYASASLMLIRKDALQTMKQTFPELWLEESGGAHYRDSGLVGGVLQCFDGFKGPDGIFVRDDLAFCRRWIEGCGGEIWSCIDEPIVRAGDEPFLGQYLVKMHQEGICVLTGSAAPDGAQAARIRPLLESTPSAVGADARL